MSALATEADALAIELLEAAGDEKRTMAVALRLTALAMRLHQTEVAIVPPHLREPEPVLPLGVAAIWRHGRWIERRKGRRA
jgi:hypothetical protein